MVYISLFPQLIAGPIVRYSTIENEINNRKVNASDITYGLNRMILGLAKKVLLSNQLSIIVDDMLGNIGKASVFGAWFGAAVYALQVYFDFSGYSDIAIGLGRIFGFHFDENFKHPFICKDITEFWQRWHISLSTFFRDYVLYTLSSEKEENTVGFSLYGSVRESGTAQAGIIYSGEFITVYSYSLK